jgi:hypothetical protein
LLNIILTIIKIKMKEVTEEDKNNILKLNETDTYFFVDECGAFMWRMNHEMAHDRIPRESHAAIQEDIEHIRNLQRFAVENLMRFGVDPETAKDRPNGDYWKWYGFWDKWKKGMTDEEWKNLNKLMSEEKPIDEFLPKGNWRDFTNE